MSPQIRAILWAQWRSMRNHRGGKSRAGSWAATLINIAWYGLWALAAVSAGLLAAGDGGDLGMSRGRFLRATLFLVFLYWQLVPIFMASTGLSLDLRRLIVYPVPHRHLFAIEVLLRVTAAIEMAMVLAGIGIGLMFNATAPWWAPFSLVPFLLFNLFLAAGLRDMLGRFFARKGIREVLILAIVLLAASVQLIVTSFLVLRPAQSFSINIGEWWPWSVAASIAAGTATWGHAAAALAWFGAAWLFGRWQFERSLKFDPAASASSGDARGVSKLERFYRLPGLVLPDPLGIMVEKELRFLTRSPRFRLVFLMGFSFGLLIWLPMAMRGTSEGGALFGTHFLTAITVYALMLLGEVCFWNTFGFDRRAVQVYFALPVPFSSVLLAKNIASLVFVFLEASAIVLVCVALRVPVTLDMVIEALSVTIVMSVFLLAIGNMLSTRAPKPVDPDQTWRKNAAGKVQAFLLLIYLVVAAPIALAYLAAYAFDSQLAFYGVLAFDAALAGVVYHIALDSAVQTASTRKEEIITALSYAEGPVG